MIIRDGYFLYDRTEIHVIVGDVHKLWFDITSGSTAGPTLFVRPDQPGYPHYLLSAAERRVMALSTPDEIESKLDALLAVVQRDLVRRPTGRTVILDSRGGPVSAWVPSTATVVEQPPDPPEEVLKLTTSSPPRVNRGPRPQWKPGRGPVAEPESGPVTPDLPTAGDAALRRTPHLDLPATIPTAPGTPFTISVYVDDQPFDQDQAGSEILVDAPPELTKIRVRVVLLVSDHFVIDGPNWFDFDIERNRPRSRPVTFILTVAEQPPQDGTAVVTAMFSYQGRPSGHVIKTCPWGPNQASVRPTMTTIRSRQPAPPQPLVMYTASEPVDIAIEILGEGNGLDFKCVVQARTSTGTAMVTTDSYGLAQRAPEMVATKLEAMRSKTSTPEQRSDALRRAGYDFWNAAPRNVKSTLWQLIDEGRTLRSISIVSEEPSLPWELMIPIRPPRLRQTIDELPPLGVAYAIGRWCRRPDSNGATPTRPAPPPTIPLTTAFVVAPRYNTMAALDARAEVAVIRTMLNGRRLRRASQQAFDTYFRRHSASALHFVCHGASGVDNDDVLFLDDDQALPSASLYTTDGLKQMCRQHAPFVFINACSTGAQVPGLTGGAGFPLAFGNIGARAIVAPLWPVNSTIASEVAVDLYTRALVADGPPVAEVLRTIRARAYTDGGADSYAAYAFYGDPHARFTIAS